MMWDDDDIYSNIDFSGGYLSNIAPPFEEVIYPKGDPDAVLISKRDVELLQPEIFMNDTIIDFYIKYLKNKIPLNKKQRFHFFNSFFFRKLADLDKERGSVSEGRSAFLRVRKWTRKVNIFEKDYIFIPVNFNLHWSLLVICHPGEAAKMKDGNVEDFPKLPCVLHMDSLKGTHSGVKSIIQSYIWEEWKERHPESLENGSTNFSSLRFVPLELPQQDNLFDCGLFLLHYVELFLEEAPLELNPLKISRFGTFLTADWFQSSEASLKRSVIWNLIYKLINDPDEQAMAPPCNNDRASQATAEHDDGQGTIVALLSERHSASLKKVPDDANFCEIVKYDLRTEMVLQEFPRAPTVPSPCNNGRLAAPENPEHGDGQGAIVELFEGHSASPKQVADNDDFSEVGSCDAQPEVVLQEFLKQGAPVIPFLQHLEHANHYNALHPAFTPAYCVLLDDACTSEQFVLTNIGSGYNHYLDGQLNVEPCKTSLSHMEVGPHERSVNPTEESVEQYLLHDYLNLKDNDFQEDESFVAADNSGFVTDFVVSICQKKPNGHTKKFQENDETKSEEGDSGGCPRVHADEEDEEDHHKSYQIAEPVDSVNEDKDVPVGDTVMLVGSTDHNNMTETLSEHCQEDCITKTVAVEHGCQQMSVDDGKTEDRDGQKNPFQIASPDEFQENDETKSQKGDSGGSPRVHADGKDEEDHISCEIAGDSGGSSKVHADIEDEEDRHKSCQIAESVDALSEDKDVPMGDTVIQVGSTNSNNMMEAIFEHFKEDHSTKVITEEHDCQQMSVDEGKTEDCDGQKNPSKIASPDKFQENDEIKSEEGDSGGWPRVHANEEDEEDHQISCKIARDSTGFSRSNADKEDEEDHHKICQIAESVNAASEDKKIPMADTVIQVGSIDCNYMTQTISEHCQEDCSTKAVAKEQDCQQMSVDEGRTGDCDGQKNPSQIASTYEFTAGDASLHDGVQTMDMVHRKPNKKRKLHGSS